MIPYYQSPTFQLGPLTLAPFGFLAAAGIYVAARITVKRAAEDGRDSQVLADYAFWGVASGVLLGHWVHLFLYHPEELARGPLQILKVWDGLSSFGGLLGGILAALVFFHLRKVRFRDYGDALALGVAPGWGIARLGCFVAHDHPGLRTDFPLAVAFPGGARHDLGLYDAVVLFSIAIVLFILRKRRLLTGRLLPLLAILYGLGRFFLDFLRAQDLAYVDARYWGLTPAQYACILLWIYGLAGFFWVGARPQAIKPPASGAAAP